MIIGNTSNNIENIDFNNDLDASVDFYSVDNEIKKDWVIIEDLLINLAYSELKGEPIIQLGDDDKNLYIAKRLQAKDKGIVPTALLPKISTNIEKTSTKPKVWLVFRGTDPGCISSVGRDCEDFSNPGFASFDDSLNVIFTFLDNAVENFSSKDDDSLGVDLCIGGHSLGASDAERTISYLIRLFYIMNNSKLIENNSISESSKNNLSIDKINKTFLNNIKSGKYKNIIANVKNISVYSFNSPGIDGNIVEYDKGLFDNLIDNSNKHELVFPNITLNYCRVSGDPVSNTYTSATNLILDNKFAKTNILHILEPKGKIGPADLHTKIKINQDRIHYELKYYSGNDCSIEALHNVLKKSPGCQELMIKTALYALSAMINKVKPGNFDKSCILINRNKIPTNVNNIFIEDIDVEIFGDVKNTDLFKNLEDSYCDVVVDSKELSSLQKYYAFKCQNDFMFIGDAKININQDYFIDDKLEDAEQYKKNMFSKTQNYQ